MFMNWKQPLWGLIILVVSMFALTACGPKYPKCDTDKHCERSKEAQELGQLYCVNGLCQQCRNDVDCGDASMECAAGVCERIPGYCVSSNDCPGNQACRDNRCGPECLSEADCQGDLTCRAGNCVAPPECTTDMDCDGNLVCVAERCVEPAATAPRECTLETVYFDYNSSTLTDEARRVLQQNVDCLKERNNMQVRIEGHCDERGTNEYNIALGERRARSVRSYLTSMGIAGSRITTISYGEERLLRQCGETGPESCHRVNRRAEFVGR